MKRAAHILVFAILFIWQLPQNIIGLCIWAFSREKQLIAYRNYCFAFCVALPHVAGGVSLGSFAFIAPACLHNERIIRHEVDGHTVDSKIFGPLYLFIIGIPSLTHLLLHKPAENYDNFYTERWANRHAGLQ